MMKTYQIANYSLEKIKSQISSHTYEIETMSFIRRIYWILIEVFKSTIPNFARQMVNKLLE